MQQYNLMCSFLDLICKGAEKLQVQLKPRRTGCLWMVKYVNPQLEHCFLWDLSQQTQGGEEGGRNLSWWCSRSMAGREINWRFS